MTKVLENCIYSRNFTCASSSDLQKMRLDIVILAEDSERTDLPRSATSSPYSRRELLLVPTYTWIIISSGFLRKTDLIWSFMSCVVHPGNVAILTFEFLDILWLWRYLSEVTPAKITFFRQLGCAWSWSFVSDSVETGCIVLHVLRCEKDDKERGLLVNYVTAICFLIVNISLLILLYFAAARNCFESQWNWRALTSDYVLLDHIYLATYPLRPNILVTLIDCNQLHSFLA